MDKLEILNSKLTAINDEIRDLSGSEEMLGLDAMAENVRSGNDEITVQTQLLEQAVAELQGKVDPELYDKGYAEGEIKGKAEGEQIGYDKALAEGYIKPSGTIEITENNKEYDVTEFEKANVVIPIQNKLAQVAAKTITEITEYDLTGVTAIGAYLFFDCKALTTVTTPDSVTSIGNYAFGNCSNLTNLTISEDLTSLGSYAFQNCARIKDLKIPKGITSIEAGVFYCTRLIDPIIPDGVTSIKASAFYGSIMSNITIGTGVKSISTYAFSDCRSLMEMVVLAEEPPSIQSSTFNNVPATCIIKVKANSVDKYKTATNWSARADYIVAIEE